MEIDPKKTPAARLPRRMNYKAVLLQENRMLRELLQAQREELIAAERHIQRLEARERVRGNLAVRRVH